MNYCAISQIESSDSNISLEIAESLFNEASDLTVVPFTSVDSDIQLMSQVDSLLRLSYSSNQIEYDSSIAFAESYLYRAQLLNNIQDSTPSLILFKRVESLYLRALKHQPKSYPINHGLYVFYNNEIANMIIEAKEAEELVDKGIWVCFPPLKRDDYNTLETNCKKYKHVSERLEKK